MKDAARPAALREDAWSRLGEPWDLLVVGGGITGAGILREGTRAGLRALLVEARDIAGGTSSRSSKLVHGGLRYLSQGNLKLTSEMVHERERLLREGPGLVEPLGFVLAAYPTDRAGRLFTGAGLLVFDLLAGRMSHRHLSAAGVLHLAPRFAREGLKGGFLFVDAETDDARLVFRVIREAVAGGASALNYVRAEALLLEGDRVVGARVVDALTGRTQELRARVVVNATGAHADRLRAMVGARPRMRPLRGSHLVFPAWRLPTPQAMTVFHPRDQRPLFILPWEGATIVGTTDLDHAAPLDEGPVMSTGEADYLMEALRLRFPSLGLRLEDAISAFSGIRPVIGTGERNPSKESRDHVIWEEKGLLTVTGGKLTNFRLIALDALKAIRARLPRGVALDEETPILDCVPAGLLDAVPLDEGMQRRLLGRYGAEAGRVVEAARQGELRPLEPTPVLPAEIRWAARSEWVVHLDDLLLRRVRLGLFSREGGAAHLPLVERICREELGWDAERWKAEVAAYRHLWRTEHRVPAAGGTEAA